MQIMDDASGDTHPLHTGSLLLAHPAMRDPHFRRSIVLLSAHEAEDGSMGVILNRPLGLTLGVAHPPFQDSPLADIPVFEGGPVQTGQLLLAAWKCFPEKGWFQLFFGISAEAAADLLAHEPEAEVRAFQGYAGWSKGQLEEELDKNAWLTGSATAVNLRTVAGKDSWRELLLKIRPELVLLADLPPDPGLN